MASFSTGVLSGSTSGQPIKVAATAIGSGTTIHAAHATAVDYVSLWATNTTTAEVALTIGWGGTTDPDHLICDAVLIPINSKPVLVIDRIPLTGGLIVKASAGTANVILIDGDYIRYTA
jgi:hypothetical protein